MSLETFQFFGNLFALFSESAGLVLPLDNCCTNVLGSTRTQLAESGTFAGVVSPAARLVQITT